MHRRPGHDGADGDCCGRDDDVDGCQEHGCRPVSSTVPTARRRQSYEDALGDWNDSCAVFPDADDDDDDEVPENECRLPFLDSAPQVEAVVDNVSDEQAAAWSASISWQERLVHYFNQLIVHLTDGKRRGAGAIAVGKLNLE